MDRRFCREEELARGGGRGVGNKGCGRLVTMNEIKRNHDSKRKKIIQGKGWEGNGVS